MRMASLAFQKPRMKLIDLSRKYEDSSVELETTQWNEDDEQNKRKTYVTYS